MILFINDELWQASVPLYTEMHDKNFEVIDLDQTVHTKWQI